MTVSAIVLAAGAGTRMRSHLPKPLHPICGRPMVLHSIAALERLAPTATVVVVGHGADDVVAAVTAAAPAWANIRFAEQTEQLGTGHATSVGIASLDTAYDEDATIVLIPGDAPLLKQDTLDELVADHVAHDRAATLLTSVADDPTGLGRIIRHDDGTVQRIVEQRDASADQLSIREVNTSIYAFRGDLLGPALRSLNTDNAQGEFYLTDVVENLASMGHRIGAVTADATETQGVNNRWQLALAERELRNRINRRWLLNGVTMFDPRQTFIDIDVQLGHDVTLYPSVMLRGNTVVGDNTRIGPNVEIVDSTIGTGAVISHSVVDRGRVTDNSVVGPFAHLTNTAPAAGTSSALDDPTIRSTPEP